jgi:O-antigen ligase
MTSRGWTLEDVGSWLLIGSLGVVQFKIAPAQVLFGLAAIIWLVLQLREGRNPQPAFLWPLVAYGVLTLVSAAFSADRVWSLVDCKQLVLFLMVPMVARLLRGRRAMTAIDVIMALGAAGALVGIVEYAMLGYDNLDKRPRGMLSHYMTYSGVLMLVTGTAAARLLFYPSKRLWPGVAMPALLVAIALTLTLNAYIGTAVALTVLVAIRNWKLVALLPVVAAIGLAIAPAHVRSRVLTVSAQQDSNRDRLQMIEMGRDMIRDHPLVGVGPDMVGRVYGRYLRPNPVHTYNPHLHNVPVQIAAERGLPAFAAWLVFVVIALLGLFRQVRLGPAHAVAGAGLAAVVAMLSAGLFEYNFGDSEFLMLFLGLITLPFAASMGGDWPFAGADSPIRRTRPDASLEAGAEAPLEWTGPEGRLK